MSVLAATLWSISGLLPGEGDVAPRHLLQVVDRRRLAGEAVVGVVVGHDGGGPELTELAVRTLQLQLDGLQLSVFTPVHWWDGNKKRSFTPPQRRRRFRIQNTINGQITESPKLLQLLFPSRAFASTKAAFMKLTSFVFVGYWLLCAWFHICRSRIFRFEPSSFKPVWHPITCATWLVGKQNAKKNKTFR